MVRQEGQVTIPVRPIEEVQAFVTHWLWTYNHERPNMALGGITPDRSWRLPPSCYFATSGNSEKWGDYRVIQDALWSVYFGCLLMLKPASVSHRLTVCFFKCPKEVPDDQALAASCSWPDHAVHSCEPAVQYLRMVI